MAPPQVLSPLPLPPGFRVSQVPPPWAHHPQPRQRQALSLCPRAFFFLPGVCDFVAGRVSQCYFLVKLGGSWLVARVC